MWSSLRINQQSWISLVPLLLCPSILSLHMGSLPHRLCLHLMPFPVGVLWGSQETLSSYATKSAFPAPSPPSKRTVSLLVIAIDPATSQNPKLSHTSPTRLHKKLASLSFHSKNGSLVCYKCDDLGHATPDCRNSLIYFSCCRALRVALERGKSV